MSTDTVPTTPPTGLFLYGTDGKAYQVKDPTVLEPVAYDELKVHGFGVPVEAAPADAPKPSESDVEGHDMDGCGMFHGYWKRGWIYSMVHGRWVFAPHYHPYGTDFAIIRF